MNIGILFTKKIPKNKLKDIDLILSLINSEDDLFTLDQSKNLDYLKQKSKKIKIKSCNDLYNDVAELAESADHFFVFAGRGSGLFNVVKQHSKSYLNVVLN